MKYWAESRPGNAQEALESRPVKRVYYDKLKEPIQRTESALPTVKQKTNVALDSQ